MHTYYINVVLMCEIIKSKEQLKLDEAAGSPLETWHWPLGKWRVWLCPALGRDVLSSVRRRILVLCVS